MKRQRADFASSRKPWAEAILSALTRPLLGKLSDVEVDQAAVAELRRLAERGPIVFLPAHRTYLDTLVLAKALRTAGLKTPWRLAGSNLDFWPLGSIGRRSGMLFIRREFGTDPAYHAAMRARLAELLADGQGIEWYPEAGRSRTGRIRKLRTGMLRILVGAYADAGVEDVHVVPVSVVYDALSDLASLTAQDAGERKQPEGLGALIHYLLEGRRFGPRRAWMAFGEPVSLREVRRESAGEWDAARTLAKRVAAVLREATQVTAEALVALAFAATGDEPVYGGELMRRVRLLMEFAEGRRIPLCRPLSVEAALDGLVRTRVLQRVDRTAESAVDGLAGTGVLGRSGRVGAGYAVVRGRERILAYHRTIAEHWFLPCAAAELVADGAVTVERISTLLTQPEGFAQRVRDELEAADGRGAAPFRLAPGLLGPVFRAYYAVALDVECAPASVELRDAALALLGSGDDAAARVALARELGGLASRLSGGGGDVRG